MTEDIMLGIIRKADELGLDEVEVASDEIARLRARIAELETALKHMSKRAIDWKTKANSTEYQKGWNDACDEIANDIQRMGEK